jgi:hypothetical protein
MRLPQQFRTSTKSDFVVGSIGSVRMTELICRFDTAVLWMPSLQNQSED